MLSWIERRSTDCRRSLAVWQVRSREFLRKRTTRKRSKRAVDISRTEGRVCETLVVVIRTVIDVAGNRTTHAATRAVFVVIGVVVT